MSKVNAALAWPSCSDLKQYAWRTARFPNLANHGLYFAGSRESNPDVLIPEISQMSQF